MAREFENDEEILVWADSLDERWPERFEHRTHIVEQLKGIDTADLNILELCSGDGRFAREITTALPDAHYVGLDASESLLEYARKQSQQAVTCIYADLREDNWVRLLGLDFDAVITLQSMHDVGGPEEIAFIYGLSLSLLKPGGLLLVADFMVPEDEITEKHPGRLPISWHLRIFLKTGFAEARCSLETGTLSCCIGRKPAPDREDA